MKYKVIRTNRTQEWCCVEADSPGEAKEKAIDNNCWNEVPSDALIRYEYITIRESNESN